MRKHFLRINGRGNAWPVPMGQEHPFYMEGGNIDHANASFSLMEYSAPDRIRENINWELLVDAGHGSIPFLLNNNNRIPDAIFITHPHFDHILGIDWIAQSYYQYNNKEKYPLYATPLCWETILKTIPHLEEIISFHPLEYGERTGVSAAGNVFVTAFPVFHGSYARGAVMLLFETEGDRDDVSGILFTGDVLFPLLREPDYNLLTGIDLLVADSNNRFPYPGSNHWSMDSHPSGRLAAFIEDADVSTLLKPHSCEGSGNSYFDLFMTGTDLKTGQCTTVFELVKRLRPQITLPVHYSGSEDIRYYNQDILTKKGLQDWLDRETEKHDLPTKFVVPDTGDHYNLDKG